MSIFHEKPFPSSRADISSKEPWKPLYTKCRFLSLSETGTEKRLPHGGFAGVRVSLNMIRITCWQRKSLGHSLFSPPNFASGLAFIFH